MWNKTIERGESNTGSINTDDVARPMIIAPALEQLESRLLFSSIQTLTSFDGINGAHPEAGLILSGNILYGTTADGGAFGDGAVFSIPASGGAPTMLASFNGTDGSHPLASLIIDGGTLYGTTSQGGADNGDGTVFAVPIGGGAIRVLASFNGTNGQKPDGELALSGDTLYGTTQYGGAANGDGTVFSLPIGGGGSINLLASFDGTDGADPYGALILSGDKLIGTTAAGGTDGDGVVFSLPTTGGTPTVLGTLDDAADKGELPQNAGLILSGDILYGTAIDGGNNGAGDVFSKPFSGDVAVTPDAFSVPIGSSTANVLASFDGANGASPSAGLVILGSTVYGTTANGGANGDGTVFALSIPSNVGEIEPLAGASGKPLSANTATSETVIAGHIVKLTASGASDSTVQWYVKKAGAKKFTAIKGAISTTLDVGKVTILDSGNQYEAVFKNDLGQTTTATIALAVKKAK